MTFSFFFYLTLCFSTFFFIDLKGGGVYVSGAGFKIRHLVKVVRAEVTAIAKHVARSSNYI